MSDNVSHDRLIALRQQLIDHYGLEELRTLCFDLGVEYDSLPGEGKASKARELVAFLARKERIAALEQLIAQPSTLPHPSPPVKPSASAGGPALIVTATKLEAQAVLAVFSEAAGVKWTRQPIGNKTYYNIGIHGRTPTFMVQSEMGTATPGGALVTVRQAIQDLRPQAVIMCGIAFGLQPGKQQVGDILVAKQLCCYEPQKVDLRRGRLARGDRATCSERLLDRFRSGDIDWGGAPTHFGLMLSGEKLVNDPAFRDELLAIEPEAIGGEMEGTGLYVAARDAGVEWILVKAICDWADGEKDNRYQTMAAHNAALFARHVLGIGG